MATTCYFISDLHGRTDRFQKLFKLLIKKPPEILFFGGDIMPSGLFSKMTVDIGHKDFLNGFLAPALAQLRDQLKQNYPEIYIILGNDDGKYPESSMLGIATEGLWQYAHNRHFTYKNYEIYGYSYVPPSPFQLKDWERYDVSRYVDPGCVSPEEGMYSIPVADNEKRYRTIKEDLEKLTEGDDLTKAIFLFHAPPYKTKLDRAALDGKMIDYVPLDVHVGSIAMQRFIQSKQPLLTLHGHIHESSRLTGAWRDKQGKTDMFNASHDGDELCVIQFDLEDLESANRLLL
ncbi:metallophosphoesterase [bacterium]|nr:metallophosphoesterase [bacterium]